MSTPKNARTSQPGVTTYSVPGITEYLKTSGGTMTGPLVFSGAGVGVQGDFTNSTISSRALFKSTVVGASYVTVVPNSSSAIAGFQAYSASSPVNTPFGYLRVNPSTSAVEVGADRVGSGSYLPLDFYTSGTKRLSISSGGDITLQAGTYLRGDFSNASIGSRVMVKTSTSSSGTNFEAIPSSTGLTSGTMVSSFIAGDGNSSGEFIQLGYLVGQEGRVQVGTRGSTYFPLTLWAGGAERIRCYTSGGVGITGGGVAFLTSGSRIVADFSNATITNRLAFQSSTTNGATNLIAIPNGTSTTCSMGVWNNSNPTNASNTYLMVNTTGSYLVAGLSGGGSYLPLIFQVNGGDAARLSVSGNLLVGTGTDSGYGKIFASGFISASSGYKVNGSQVVGAPISGWADQTLYTVLRSNIDQTTITLQDLARVVKTIIDDLRTHGLFAT